MLGNVLRHNGSAGAERDGNIAGWAVVVILFAVVAFASFALDLSLCTGVARHAASLR